MASAQDHYAAGLSRVYTWMCGGLEPAVQRNVELLARLGIEPRGSARAVDLGSGSGFQSIALARAGFAVTAIDFDAGLCRELEKNAGELPITVVHDDLLRVAAIVEPGVEVAVCMTDTVLHLESTGDVQRLFSYVYSLLEPSGRLVITFRDLTHTLEGVDRFIPVRGDADRIMTCFLEYESDHVRVHDLIYDRRGEQWALTKSWYRKLRLSPEWVDAALRQAGFAQVESNEKGGLVTAVATRA